MKRNTSYRVAGDAGKLKTPWDQCFSHFLIRKSSIPDDPPFVLELGVNYFVLKLESMRLKTLWSCEGHPNGFYIVFKAPYKVAQKIAFVSHEWSIEVNIAKIYNHKGKKEWFNNCWILNFIPITNCINMSYERRNYLLRGLSNSWEKKL